MKRELASTLPSYHVRMTASLRRRSSAISEAWAICVAEMAFMRSVIDINAALCDVSGIGLSLTAVSEDSIEGKVDAEARTMDRNASMDSCDGGSDADAAWKKSG